MVKHIGIVACSAEGAALCYRTICSEGTALFGAHGHPEVTMHTPPFSRYAQVLDKEDWQAVGELMLASAKILKGAGADFLICPDNTVHQALPLIEAASPLPWLNIAEVVADHAAERGVRKLGLTGTKWLVESDVYPDPLKRRRIDHVLPTPDERQEMNRIIMDELVNAVFKPEAVSFFQNAIASMKTKGCDAVVLGCTEIPLIINDENAALPTLDSTRLLARAALKRAAT